MKTVYHVCVPLILLLTLCSASPLFAQAPLAVTNPTAATVWEHGGSYTVAWSGGAAAWNMNIQLLDQGFINVADIALNIPNSGSETYTVPAAVPAGIYYVFVEGVDQGTSQGWAMSEPFHIIEGSVSSESTSWGSVKALFN